MSIRELGKGQTLQVTAHIKPNAKENMIVVEPDGTVTMRVHAPPTKGKANREIVRHLAKKLAKPSSHVRIVEGLHSNLKTIEIRGVNRKQFLEAISRNSPANSSQSHVS